MKLPATTVKTPVRVRRTLIHQDEAKRAYMVYCPVKRRSCAFEICRECERCTGITLDADNVKHVLCTVDEPPPRLRKLLPTAADATPIGALVSREVTCVSAALGHAEAVALFLARGLSGAPVVDDEGRPLGMLARSDLLRAATERPAPRSVADVMTGLAFTLGENDAVSRAVALMAAEGVHHLPVIGDCGRVVGMLSTLDVARWLARQSGYDV
jgi:CBS domain-containing protein